MAAATTIAVGVAVKFRWYAAAVGVVVAGVAAAWLLGPPDLGTIVIDTPTVAIPPLSVWGTACVLLVIPQLPLTYGNAVVGMSDLAREQFSSATRVSPGAVALSCGLGNVGSALLGGMPMCHGSSGFSAHVRLGARTSAMNVMLGAALITLGLVFSHHVLALFGLLPVWALAGFLAYAGIRHALLVFDLRGTRLLLACLAAAVGIVTENLVYTTAIALAV